MLQRVEPKTICSLSCNSHILPQRSGASQTGKDLHTVLCSGMTQQEKRIKNTGRLGLLTPPLRGNLLPLLLLLPSLQSVVSAARAFPPLLRRPPLGAIGHHPLGLGVSSSLGCPVLGSASPTVGFSRSSIPCVMFIGLSAILSAAFGISHVCPLFPMW